MLSLLRSRHRNYLFLMPLFAIAIAYHIAYVITAVVASLHATERPQMPFYVDARGEVVANSEMAHRAGINNGARLVSVEGASVKHVMALAEALRHMRPGEQITVSVQGRGETAPHKHSFRLEPEKSPSITDWAVTSLILLVSLLSAGVGIYVALRLPNDISALSTFGVLEGLVQMVHVVGLSQWPRWASAVAASYSMLMQGTWPISMMLFGIYFPTRSKWDRRWPWLKWCLITPIALYWLLNLAAAAIAHFNLAASRPLHESVAPFGPFITVLSLIAPSAFFYSLGAKGITERSADLRRRLHILWVGACVSLTPLLLLLLYVVLWQHGEFGGIPQYIEITVVVFMLMFPITLAYVVLTQRAMELRVVIRQGVRYAFAKAGWRIIVGLAVTLFMWGLSNAIFSTRLRRPVQIAVYAICVVAVIVGVRRLRTLGVEWIDRKFFREAYNTEVILNELNDSIRTMIDEPTLLETVASRISESLHVPCVAILLNDSGRLAPTHILGCSNTNGVALRESAFVVQQARLAKDPAPIYLDTPSNWIFEAPEGEIEAVRDLSAQLILPISVRERLLGVLSLGPKRSEEPYSRSDVKLLQSVVFQTGLALENSRLANRVAREVAEREKLNREIEIAREVQERLFPQNLPKLPGIDYSGACRPAQGVAGDYYDFIALAGGDLGIAIGDVSGKGIAAALLMASLQASLRGQALQGTSDLTQVMSNINRLVCDATSENRYATFFYGQYERATRRFTYVNAGHNPPVVLRRTQEQNHLVRLDIGGLVVGLFRETTYQQACLTLEAGDIFVGFTDGISEAMNARQEEWGEERLIPALEVSAGRNAAEIIRKVMAEADRFVDGAPQYDDMTLVVMKLESA